LSDTLLLGKTTNRLIIVGTGSLNARNCDEFRKQMNEMLDDEPLESVHLDLSECSYMDSTFLGVLVGIHKKNRQNRGKGLYVHKPSKAAQDHLESMGIHKILTITSEPLELPSYLEPFESKKTEHPQDILSAHQHLMELSPENRKRFAILAQVLENQIEHPDN
jgi:anti-anti-sigma factor